MDARVGNIGKRRVDAFSPSTILKHANGLGFSSNEYVSIPKYSFNLAEKQKEERRTDHLADMIDQEGSAYNRKLYPFRAINSIWLTALHHIPTLIES